MPKGGDIHHHVLGSVYAEDALELAAKQGFWIDPRSAQLYPPTNKHRHSHALKVTDALKIPSYYEHFIDQLSIRNYTKAKGRAHDHFFDVFPKISPVFDGNEGHFLGKIREQAEVDNVQYIESMIIDPKSQGRMITYASEFQWDDKAELNENLEQLYQFLLQKDIQSLATMSAQKLEHWDNEATEMVPNEVVMRYQIYALRVLAKEAVFAQLMLSFLMEETSDIIVGVNLVGIENNRIALRDYSLHMKMVQFLRKKHPQTHLALHAGEISAGLVIPQNIHFHIKEAVEIAKAERIGHGSDIAFEKDHLKTLQTMREKGIAIELPLFCNAFLLDIEPNEVPLEVYRKANVPIVLATDDSAILRSDLTTVFITALQHYPSLDYPTLKSWAYNSIHYSFLKDETKQAVKERLDRAFNQFESDVLASL